MASKLIARRMRIGPSFRIIGCAKEYRLDLGNYSSAGIAFAAPAYISYSGRGAGLLHRFGRSPGSRKDYSVRRISAMSSLVIGRVANQIPAAAIKAMKSTAPA